MNHAGYEMLLTLLCQLGLASSWGWRRPVRDEARARTDVVTYALRFGSRVVQHLAVVLRHYISRDRLHAPLMPIVGNDGGDFAVFHITAATLDLREQVADQSVWVWDAGKGSRMGQLVSDRPKGDVELVPGHSLRRFAAAAAGWMVGTLLDGGSSYVAIVASDQVVCLDDRTVAQLQAILSTAAAQRADLIFFDGPPALSLRRLHPLVDRSRCPRKNSALALARDRTMLKHYGGAHVFQCVLVRTPLHHLLANVLECLVQAANQGYALDYGVMDAAVIPRFIEPVWLRRESHPWAVRLCQSLAAWRQAVGRVFPVSIPMEVFNVNTPTMLSRLRTHVVLPVVQEGAMP